MCACAGGEFCLSIVRETKVTPNVLVRDWIQLISTIDLDILNQLIMYAVYPVLLNTLQVDYVMINWLYTDWRIDLFSRQIRLRF